MPERSRLNQVNGMVFQRAVPARRADYTDRLCTLTVT